MVEALGGAGLDFLLERCASTVMQGRHWLALFTFADGHDTGQVPASTAPLAICRAALLTRHSSLAALPSPEKTAEAHP